MIAILLCAGFSTRLDPLTRETPNALLDVAGRPVLDGADGGVAVTHRKGKGARLEGRAHAGVFALGHPALERHHRPVEKDGHKAVGQNLAGPIDLLLTGDIELIYRFGDGAQPEAEIALDIISFNRLASERIKADQLPASTIRAGDPDIAKQFLEQIIVPY